MTHFYEFFLSLDRALSFQVEAIVSYFPQVGLLIQYHLINIKKRSGFYPGSSFSFTLSPRDLPSPSSLSRDLSSSAQYYATMKPSVGLFWWEIFDTLYKLISQKTPKA